MKKIITIVACSLFFISCEKEDTTLPKVEEAITNIKAEAAPDKRVAMFAISAEKNKENYVLKGMSNQPEAVAKLKETLAEQQISIVDSIEILPHTNLKGKIYGVVNNSVANIRSKAGHSSELATQATLGTPLNILKHEGDWYLVQTPDGYISWVDHGGIITMTKDEFTNWKASTKVIYTQTYGYSYQKEDTSSQMVSDLVAGDIVSLLETTNNFYKVGYPDGREAYIHKTEATIYKDWLQQLSATNSSLVETSKTLLGLPYLWGGTSAKGVDCSGFTKTIYFMNGMVIPRDASQQVYEGELIDTDKDFSKLQPGDLLFFGRIDKETGKEKVVHVGMWIGNNQFIHSSGRVKINSMDKDAANFDAFNYNRYLRTKRILGQQTKGLQYLANNQLFESQE
jgi:cell wall-associated NlpC family hydrolase